MCLDMESKLSIINVVRVGWPMGLRKDQTSVVDEKMKVIGVKNLRVIDGSIMP